MKAPVSWLREFADVRADAHAIASRLSLCGFETASIEHDTIDFEITANRPDCLSVYGLAREASVAFDVPLAPAPGAEGDGPRGGAPVHVSIADPGCGRYALAIAEVKIAASPSWLAERLVQAGVRPINNIVDVTNYVMLELGHPMHAFDLAKLSGPEIRVRRARPAERLVTLDGQDRALDDNTLVIADRERAVAIAGVMGGAASEVSATTTHVAIESAWFLPAAVRMASRRLALKTEASARFERGADLTAPVRALRRGLELIEKIGVGHATGAIADVYPRPAERRTVALRRQRVARLLGDAIPDAEIERILTGLGFGLTPSADGWTAAVPAFRVDVAREADLIEEVGRHVGFERIPATFPPLRSVPRPAAPSIERDRRLRRVLCAAGLQEACTFTFIEEAAAAPFAGNSGAEAGLLRIANPLSEKFAVLRPSLLPGLLDAVVHNRHRETTEIRLFESGATFGARGERAAVAWLLTGTRDDHWSGRPGAFDFYDAAGVADAIAATFGLRADVQPIDDVAYFTRGRAAAIAIGENRVGVIGELHGDVVAARGLGRHEKVVGGEIDLAALTAAASSAATAIEPLPRFPSIVRDLSIVVADGLPAADLRGTIRAHAARTLVDVREFDRYRGKGIPDGQVSLSFRLTFRDPERTLTDAEVQQAVDAIVAALEHTHGAKLRGT